LEQIKIKYNNDNDRYYNNYNNRSYPLYSGSLFGTNQNVNNQGDIPYPTGGSLFGNTNIKYVNKRDYEREETGKNIFSGFNETNQYSNDIKGLFGNSNNKNSFTNSDNQSGGGLFGNNNRNVGLFGNTNDNHNVGLFGNTNDNRNVGLFGNTNDNRNVGLFGTNDNRNVGLFCKNTNNNQSGGLFGNNYCKENEKRNETEYNLNDNNKEKDNIENIIMSLDIIDGFWDENAYTKSIIEMKRDIYNKVKSFINDNKIAITFIILYYIINDRKDKIAEYSNIINKAKTFLVNSGHSYENIISSLGFF
jgi:hypothetical protein